jgi:hypothetical protein
MAVLLVYNSVANYQAVSRQVAEERLKNELAARATTMEREIRTTGEFSSALRAVDDKVEWTQLIADDGTVLAASSKPRKPAFDVDEVRDHLRNRKQIFKILETKAGAVLVQAFPVFLPSAEGRPRFAVLEMAGSLDGETGGLWAVRQSLLINVSAALALVISVGLLALRFRSYLAGRQLEQQLQIAREVQRNLLPAAERKSDLFEVAADCMPARMVGGDFYDTEGDTFVLGDVSGKGIPAALLMGVMHGAVRSCSWTDSAKSHEIATSRIDRLLQERASSEQYSSMFWAYFEPKAGLLRYINAGHCPPLLFRAGRRNPVRLEEGGPVLGLVPNAKFKQGSVMLGAGDLLVMYSDGIAESANAADEMFGEERIISIVRENMALSAVEIRDRILAAVREFTGQETTEDDRTLVVVRHTASNLGTRQLPEAA